jgi:hypothetical protein
MPTPRIGPLGILSATGSMLYRDANGDVTEVVPGSDGQQLTLSAGIPIWANGGTPATNDFRLTGVSATPVMTADNNALTTIYAAQYTGARIALYDGAQWNVRSSAEFSLALSGRTTDLPFDIFCYDNAGTPTLEFLDWTNATTRATALVRQDGVWCKTGALTRRYLGSCRARVGNTFSFVRDGVTTASGAGTTARLDLWNVDNQIEDRASQIDTTNTWTYTLLAFRQANGSTTNQIEIMVGLPGKMVEVDAFTTLSNSSGVIAGIGIGLDSVTVNSAQVHTSNGIANGAVYNQSAKYNAQPAIGRHFLAWLENSTATGTTTWVGDNNNTNLHQSGMMLRWWC